MPESREPIVTHAERYMAVPGNHGECAVCLHAYDEHWIRFDGGLQQCTGTDINSRYACECLEYVPS